MAEYDLTASVELQLKMNVEADSPEKAKEIMRDWLDVSANIESDCFTNIMIMDYDIEDVNEV